jgi:ribosomal protein L3 glutamine methyltransferase
VERVIFMAEVSHSRRPPRPGSPTVGELLARSTRRLAAAKLHYGHGTDCARDDAAALVFHVLGLTGEVSPRDLGRRVSKVSLAAVDGLVTRRIRERIPVVYLTHRIWFCGLPMYVDERALIPRSPIAELIEARFQPWIDPARVKRILDVGTGSGCIAIACALAFPEARVDAVDISPDALAVARINRAAYGLTRRLRLVESDYFSALAGPPYDIIVSNPPYVGTSEFKGLPAEYAHEPEGALRAGRDGMDAVRVLLREALRFLTPDGILVVEVGNTETTVRRQFRDWPFIWLEFSRGGGGVFLLTAVELRRMAKRL